MLNHAVQVAVMKHKKIDLTIHLPFATYLLSTLFSNVDNIVIFGGYIRDYILAKIYQKNIIPNDLDVVISSLILPHNYEILKNRFNGNTIFVHNTRIDFWELKDTFSLINANKSITIDKLPETTVFNCNSIAYDVKTCQLYGAKFFEFLETRTIDFNDTSYLYDFKELQAVRAFYLSKKLKFKLSSDVMDFLYTTFFHSNYLTISNIIHNSKYDNFSLIWNIYKYLFSSKKYNNSYCEKYIINKFFST